MAGVIRKRTYIQGWFWGGQKTRRSPHPPDRLLKVYKESLMRSRHIFSIHGLKNTLLFQGYILENGSPVQVVSGTYTPRVEER